MFGRNKHQDPLQYTEVMVAILIIQNFFEYRQGPEISYWCSPRSFYRTAIYCLGMLISIYVFEAVSCVSHTRRSEELFANRRLAAVASLCELLATTCVCDRAASRYRISLRAACSYMCLRLGSQPLSHLLVSCLQLHVFAFGRLAADASLFEVHA